MFNKAKQELIGLTALLLASKFDELDDNIPLIREFQRAARYKSFTYEEVSKCEYELLDKMNWDLFHLTSFHIVESLIG